MIRAGAALVVATLAAACATAGPAADAPLSPLAPLPPPPAPPASPQQGARASSHAGSDGEVSAEAYRAVLEAEIRFQTGDLPGGIEHLREAVLHDPASPYLRVRLGEAYLEAGDAEQARAAAKDALAIDRKYVPAWRVLGEAWSAAGDKQAAKKAYEEGLAAVPGDRDTSMQLAELLVEDGELDGAEHIIESLMEKEPGAVDGYVDLARVFAERGEVERAFKHLDRALFREPADVDALSLKLTLLWALGRFDDALPVAKAVAAASGDGPDVRRDLLSATALASKDKGGGPAEADALAKEWLADDGSEQMRLLVADAWERAGQPLRAVTTLVPLGTGASPRAAATIGRLRLALHDPAAAAAAVCPAVDAPDADARLAAAVTAVCLRTLVRAHRLADAGALVDKKLATLGGEPAFLEGAADAAKAGAGHNDELLKRADDALADKPADADVVAVAARAHEDLGDIARARDILDEALRARPKDPDLLFALARHLDRQKQPLPAVEIVERLIDRGRKGVDELNFVAFTLADAGSEPDVARKDAWRALVQDPLNGYVVDTLGWAELAAGDVDAAVATLKRADRLSPGEGEVLFHLGAALAKKGDRQEALTMLRRAHKLLDDGDPDGVAPRLEALLADLAKP